MKSILALISVISVFATGFAVANPITTTGPVDPSTTCIPSSKPLTGLSYNFYLDAVAIPSDTTAHVRFNDVQGFGSLTLLDGHRNSFNLGRGVLSRVTSNHSLPCGEGTFPGAPDADILSCPPPSKRNLCNWEAWEYCLPGYLSPVHTLRFAGKSAPSDWKSAAKLEFYIKHISSSGEKIDLVATCKYGCPQKIINDDIIVLVASKADS